jgi:murein DD-endopeptidase MepM/ murein hydrolase activator NlpD
MYNSSNHHPRVSGYLKANHMLLYIIAMVVSLVACQNAEPTSLVMPPVPTLTSTMQASATATLPATPTQNLALNMGIAITPSPYATTFVMESSGALKLVNPTQEPQVTYSWRPPLYPNPWAPSLFDHFYFASPISAKEANPTVSDYRYGGVFFEDVVHTGVDIPSPHGTPILAAGPGTVVWANYGVFQGGYDPKDPYGLAVTIRHDFGYENQGLYTIYGHMSEINVVEGQHVETGDLLGLVGETGRVTGPHLHFEVRIGDNNFFTTRNPELWMVPPIGWGIISGRMTDTVGNLIYDQQLIITDPLLEQNRFAWSYGKSAVNSDLYYQENLVVGDLPAGNYVLRTAFGGMNFSIPIEVRAGVVNYFTFHGYDGFKLESPPAPGANFTPSPITTPIP